MAWSFVLASNALAQQGEIVNAYDRQVALPLSKLDTASLKVRLDHPLAGDLADSRGYLKGYRNGVLRFFGPIISAEETGDANGGSVAINAVGAGWIFGKRLVARNSTGYAFTTPTDRAEIVRQLIVDADLTGGDTHISYGNMTSASAVTYTAGPYRPLMEIINELATSSEGFDWRILPVENFSGGAVTGSKIGQMIAYPLIGVNQTNAVFEYGTGKANIVSYKRTVTRDGQANKVYHYTSNGPDAPGFPTVSAIDSTSISDWGLLEDLAQADLLDPTLRNQLVSEHVRVRAQPRQVIEFTPSVGLAVNQPQFGVDYDVGDSVRARAVYGRTTRFDDLFRVWGVNFTIDNNGVEQAVMTLAQE